MTKYRLKLNTFRLRRAFYRLIWRPIAKIVRSAQHNLDQQAESWPLWTPVALTAGAGGYFSLPWEPSPLAIAGCLALCLVLAARISKNGFFPVPMLAIACMAGFLMAKAEVWRLDTKGLPAATGLVTLSGWVKEAARRHKVQGRVVLEVDHIDGVARRAWPDRIRLTVAKLETIPLPGDYMRFAARLYPLGHPVMPGGFDYSRHLWLDGIGATGFAFEPELPPDSPTGAGKSRSVPWNYLASRWVAGVRAAISGRLREHFTPRLAGVAEALIIGQRGGITKNDHEALRIAGLAHLLAISGLHMMLVAGSAYWCVRAAGALWPALALRRPLKSYAAAVALCVGAAYLILTGGGIATQRAFIMLAIMCLAIFTGRPALSMRNLAVAAIIVVTLNPHSVISPSFQMSFMAVAGLIAAYEALTRHRFTPAFMTGWHETPLWRWGGAFVAATAFTTLIAGVFTAIPGAYHFQRLAPYSLLANVIALPIMTLAVMPALLFSVLLMPFGLESWGLALAGSGLTFVLDTAHHITLLPGAALNLARIPPFAALLMGFSAIWLCLWHGVLRWAGLVVICSVVLGIIWGPRWGIFPEPARADILVERFGANVAIRNHDGLLVPAHARRGRFSVEKWLAAEGDAVTLAQAHRRSGWRCDEGICQAPWRHGTVVYAMRERESDPELSGVCDHRQVVIIAAFPLRGRCAGAGLRIDRFDLWRQGAHAIYARRNTGDSTGNSDNFKVVTAAELRGLRPWVTPLLPRARILENGKPG